MAATDELEQVYAGARALLERLKTQRGVDVVPEGVLKIQDLLEMIEKNADRIAHMMKDSRRRRTGARWDDVKALLSEQNQLFEEAAVLFTQLSQTNVQLATR